MNSKFIKIIESSDRTETLTIGDKTFSKEVVLNQSLQCSLFATLTFSEVEFKEVDFSGSMFMNCTFKNCIFKDVTFRKCDLWNTILENCQIETSDFTRTNFCKGVLQNCSFIKVNLRASDFSELEFIRTKFDHSNLDLISARSIKVWKLNQWTEIEKSSNLGPFLKSMYSNT